MGVSLYELQAGVGVLQALAFLLALVCGGVMIYSFWLMLTTVAFWVVRMEEMVNLFEGLYAAGRWPVSVYPDWLRSGLTFLVPIAFAVTVPAEALTNRLTPQTLVGAILFSILLAVISRLFWKHGLKSYSGASA
jgi:ABC-2 type transport system permease protein